MGKGGLFQIYQFVTMATGLLGGPGGGLGNAGGGRVPSSGAEMLGSTLPFGWNKNILEIVLEKDQKGAFSVSDDDVTRIMKELGWMKDQVYKWKHYRSVLMEEA